MATRGGRNVVQVVSDAYSCPTDKTYHVSTKPEPMLKHFFRMLVDENTRLLDPTCGGGSAIRAAESMNAQAVLGLEVDEQICGTARMALRKARTLRGVSSGG
jgi:predicted RNA methylase